MGGPPLRGGSWVARRSWGGRRSWELHTACGDARKFGNTGVRTEEFKNNIYNVRARAKRSGNHCAISRHRPPASPLPPAQVNTNAAREGTNAAYMPARAAFMGTNAAYVPTNAALWGKNAP